MNDRPTSIGRFLLCLLFAASSGGLLSVDCVVATHHGEFCWDDDARLADKIAQFEQEIRPVLISQCIECHGADRQEGGLRLDSRDEILRGGDSGPAIIPGNVQESLLVDAIHYRGLEMPPHGKLDDRTITRMERWIGDGAVWPTASKLSRANETGLTDSDRQWWAFQPIRHLQPPVSSDDHWSQNEIDRFIWQALRDKHLEPAPKASKATLLRRLTFHLIGLPPTLEELDAFEQDTAADAVEKVIDRLLMDPRYGEHWARFWLDLVRYSESDGWNQDAYRPHIWRYRDYVVDAWNQDKPYPEFVRDQLAGDERPEDNPEALTAAGFLRLGIYEYNQRDARGQWNDIMNDLTDVAGDVFLGMSMSCARCHHHKFDPISQQDYFKLRAFFEPLIWRDDLVAATEEEQAEYRRRLEIWEQETASIRARLAALLEPYEKSKWHSTVEKFPLDIQACFHLSREDRTSWQDQMAYLVSRQYLEEGGGPYNGMKKEDAELRSKLEGELAEFDSLKPGPLPKIMTATDFDGILSPTYLPEDARRQAIPPGFPEVFAEIPFQSSWQVRENTSGRRTTLAQWIGDPGNPLTGRVMVNRIWQQHFGRGIVATPSDFGQMGARPTHPELLDWLTQTFIADGWSFKKLHKRILLSAAWQQSATHPNAERQQVIDPEGQLVWRARVRRLRAEQIRDAMLCASGELVSKRGGPSVDESSPRRSLYVKSFRNDNSNFLHGFDMANGLQSVAVRDSTTTPLQALLLLHGTYSRERADNMAARLLASDQPPDQILVQAFRLTWGRDPSATDLKKAEEYLGMTHDHEVPVFDETGFRDFCHVLINSNPFLYLE